MAKETMKKVYSFSAKGELNMNDGTITEVDSRGETVINLVEKLEALEGKYISIAIKEERELPIDQ